MNILIGSDPEVFAKVNGEYVSAHGMVPGTKENPHPVKDGAVQVDGMALEFNINPAASEDEFVYNLDSVMAQLQEMVPDVELAADPVAEFTPEYMAAQPDEARDLGCDPDLNAWRNGRENPKPDVNVPFRTGAGHIHIGLFERPPENHKVLAIQLAKQLDFYLGLPSVVFDQDKKRRTLYGQAGAFRLKPYGMEYRVLSNAWLRDEKLTRFVYRNTMLAIQNLSSQRPVFRKGIDPRRAISNSEADYAAELCEKLKIPMAGG